MIEENNIDKGKVKKNKQDSPKVLSLVQLLAKTYKFIDNIPDLIIRTFGKLTMNFTMMIYGSSGHGKTNLLITLIKILMSAGKVLYISCEEGFEVTMQMTAIRHLAESSAEYSGKIAFADHTMTPDALTKRLQRRRSEQFIIIDSIQYWRLSYDRYCKLKETFPNKSFIFISHREGKDPKGGAAKAILYDMSIKVFVDRYIAFIISRLEGGENYLIWEEGAKRKWGEEFYKHFPDGKKRNGTKTPPTKKTKAVSEPVKSEELEPQNETVQND